MMLNSKIRYAVMALVDLHLHSNGKPVPLADIAARQEVSLPYLEQIFAKLRRSDLVQAMRGPGGGYLLKTPAERFTVDLVLPAVDESISMTRCEHKTEVGGCMADKSQCLTHHLWAGLEQQMLAYLSGISIADIAADKVNRVTFEKVA